MQFTTPVHINPLPVKIGYRHSSLVIGSCFAMSIGERLARLKLPVLVNPFGVVYNPISVANSIELLLGKREFTADDLFYSNGLWSSFYHHSSFSSLDKDEAFEQIKLTLESGRKHISKLERVIITLGTARVYEYKKTGQVVSNCHKLPTSEFTHRLMSVEEVSTALSGTLSLLKLMQPDVEVVFTVSPIRHLKDSAHGNQLSKATLLLAVESLCNSFDNVVYFPAYEIMMDELRDYRYYADDMLHPSSLAVEYIWHKFSKSILDEEAQQLIPQLEKILAAKEHRPFNPNGEEYKTFTKVFFSKVKEFKKQYPFLSLEEELRFFGEN